MKYLITRTSIWEDEISPHPKAVSVHPKIYKDIRTFKNKEEWLEKFPKGGDGVLEWGVTEDGHPYRIIPFLIEHTLWVIEIEDLVSFVKEVGEIILSLNSETYPEYDTLLEIEIYDDYRE